MAAQMKGSLFILRLNSMQIVSQRKHFFYARGLGKAKRICFLLPEVGVERLEAVDHNPILPDSSSFHAFP